MPNRGSRPLSLTTIPCLNYPAFRNTNRRPDLSVEAVSHYALSSTTQQPSISLTSPKLDDRLHLPYGCSFFGTAKHGDFPLSSTIDVSKKPSILFYEVLTHATRYMRLLNSYQNPSYAYVSLRAVRRLHFSMICRLEVG